MINGTAERDPRCRWLTPHGSRSWLAIMNGYVFLLSATLGGGWVTLIGSEPGKLSSRPCSSDFLELAFADFLARTPRLLVDLVFGDRFVRNSHANSPCRRRCAAIP
jgi:hypothetical protein